MEEKSKALSRRQFLRGATITGIAAATGLVGIAQAEAAEGSGSASGSASTSGSAGASGSAGTSDSASISSSTASSTSASGSGSGSGSGSSSGNKGGGHMGGNSFTVEGIRKDKNGVSVMDDWLGTAPDFADGDITDEVSADIIVVGGGLSGISAARAAAEEGASVIIFEKCDSYQCRSGDFGVIGSQISIDNWGRDGTEYRMDILDEWEKASGNRANYTLLSKWADNVGAAFDWYAGAVDNLHILKETTEDPGDAEAWLQPARCPSPTAWDIENEHYKCFQFTCQFYPSQEFVFEAHTQKAMDTGLVTGYLSTPVKKLLRDDNGPVTGVIAQSYDGKVYRATANKAVILTTGDYSGNQDMLTYYNPWIRDNAHFFTSIDPEGYFANTGDGDKMAMWIGAKMEEGPHASNNHNMGGVLGSTGFLELDFHGHRFQNEDIPGQELDNRLHYLYGQGCYQIFDAKWVDEVALMAPSHGQVCAVVSDEAAAKNGYLKATYGYANQTMVDDAVTDGSVLTADTIEDLIAQFDIDDDAKTAAIAAVQTYNDEAKAGEDTEFGKTASRMFALENPPFYACKFGLGGLLVVNSGLAVDENLHVLDDDMEVIPHLYAAGNNQGGRYAFHYPITLPGCTHSTALTFGRLAGTYAAQEV